MGGQWAHERPGSSLEDAKHHFKKFAAWEAGEALPTCVQVEGMAERFKVPVAALLFPKPPEVPPLEKSFCTLTAEDFAAIPRRLRFFLRQGQAMQLNLAELNDWCRTNLNQLRRRSAAASWPTGARGSSTGRSGTSGAHAGRLH